MYRLKPQSPSLYIHIHKWNYARILPTTTNTITQKLVLVMGLCASHGCRALNMVLSDIHTELNTSFQFKGKFLFFRTVFSTRYLCVRTEHNIRTLINRACTQNRRPQTQYMCATGSRAPWCRCWATASACYLSRNVINFIGFHYNVQQWWTRHHLICFMVPC